MDRTRGQTYNEDYRNNIFYNIDLSHSNFRGANLDGARFINCILYNTDFRGARITSRTKIDFSEQRNPLRAGAKFTKRQKILLGLTEERSLSR